MDWPEGIIPPQMTYNVAVEGQVRRICKRNDVDANMIRSAAHLLYRWYNPVGTPMQQYQQLLNMLHSVGSVGASERRNTVQLNSLCIALSCLAAVRIPLSSDLAIKAVEVQEIAELLAKKGDKPATWWYMFIQPFVHNYVTRGKTVGLLRKLKPKDIDHWLKVSAGQDITALADQAGLGISQLRRYGVKPCVIDDGIIHPAGTAWVFSDGFESRNQLANPESIRHIAPVLADTVLGKFSQIRQADNIALVASHISEAPFGDFSAFSFPVAPITIAYVHENGQIATDAHIGVAWADSYFSEAGLGDLYPMFRLVHLMRLNDLVVPVEAMRQSGVHSWPIQSVRRSDRIDLTKIPFLRTLVIPRLRLLSEQKLLDQAYLSEMANSAIQTETLMRRKMGKHEVVGFVRPLPIGFQASDTARQLAWQELGIRHLPDGWTYVRTHSRGNQNNPAKGHVARR